MANTTRPKNPIFGNWWKGFDLSPYASAFFNAFVCADIVSIVGSLKCNLALSLDSGSTITEPTLTAVAPSGSVYFFSRNTGKIWKRANTGIYTVITANSNGSGHRGCYYHSQLLRVV